MPAFNLVIFPSAGAGEAEGFPRRDWAGEEGSESPMLAR